MLTVRRMAVVVSCDTCGARLRIRMTGRSRTVDRSTVAVRITAHPDDAVWAHLYQDAHRGPFTYRSAR